MNLEIIYQDEYLVAINKPHGLLVHRSPIAADATEFALQSLRDQLGQKVYLVHRIDRKTSGVLVFALNQNINAVVGAEFKERRVDKTYIAIVRGWIPDDNGMIDYDLTNDTGKTQSAISNYKVIERIELNLAFGRYQTSRYTIVEVYPVTGRMHQIRKHMSHIRYPIIGDRPYGCSKQNRLWKEKWNMKCMMLHAKEINLVHPVLKKPIKIVAEISSEMKRVHQILNYKTNF
ncbi:UNVERIFIED_CONTAM: hypothetical protein GTU68_039054 [Idotea baltica]|nr:hypothetical protein [Idotea baltica]